jgi:hypothetical protein
MVDLTWTLIPGLHLADQICKSSNSHGLPFYPIFEASDHLEFRSSFAEAGQSPSKHHASINTPPSTLPSALPAIDLFISSQTINYANHQSSLIFPNARQASFRLSPKPIFESSQFQGSRCEPYSQSRCDCVPIDHWHYGVNYLGEPSMGKVHTVF